MPNQPEPCHPPLTAREREVLEALSRGLSVAELAASLGISPSTAGMHLKNLRTKLAAATNEHAVAIGFRRGLLS